MPMDLKMALAVKTRKFLLDALDKVQSRRDLDITSRRHHYISADQSRRDPYISADQFRQLAFCVSALDWEPEGTIDFEPRFCDPFPADAFDDIFSRRLKHARRYSTNPKWREGLSRETATREEEAYVLTGYISCWLGAVDQYSDMAAHGDWMRIGKSKLYQRRHEGHLGKVWRMKDIYRAVPWPQGLWPTDPSRLRKLKRIPKQDALKPVDITLRRPGKTQLIHMACTVHESREPIDECLYRSEVISALSLMSEHVSRGPYNWNYRVFPVFVYTFSGRSVRVLQFHHDTTEQRLHIRKTPFMYIESEDEMDKIKLVMRWIMNKPKGDLKLEDLEWNPNEDEDRVEVDNQPPTPRKSSIRCV